MSDITKPKDQTQLDATKPKKFGSVSASPLQQRVAQKAAKQAESQTVNAASVATLPNRIGLMLDVSGSMSDKMVELRAAGTAFVDACDPSNTAVAINTFEPLIRINMSTAFAFHKQEIARLHSLGGTPMADAMFDMLSNEIMTRAVLVSDGEPNEVNHVMRLAGDYKEAGIPIDTVHIGDSEQGEDCLRQVAAMTGGIYMKFKNASLFATAFKYLTPSYRALLSDSGFRAKLGAS